jgi:hypothetical protein
MLRCRLAGQGRNHNGDLACGTAMTVFVPAPWQKMKDLEALDKNGNS